MPKTNTQENSGEKAEKKVKPKKKKTMLVLLVCLTVLAGSAGAAYFYLNQAAGSDGQAKKEKKAESEVLDMGEMIVNLSGGHYLRVKIVIEHPKDKKLGEELNKKKHQISDILISTLRGKTVAEVGSPGSFEGLKANLLGEINSRLEHGEVTGIYFTDFLVQ